MTGNEYTLNTLSTKTAPFGAIGMLLQTPCNYKQMPEVRVELTHRRRYPILSPARLPFRHSRSGLGNIAGLLEVENQAPPRRAALTTR